MSGDWYDAFVTFVFVTSWVIICTGLLQNAIYVVQLMVAGWELATRPKAPPSKKLWLRTNEAVPPISILVPAYNEEKTIVSALKSILSLEYPCFEVIVIDDGSKDGTLNAMHKAFGLVPDERTVDPALRHKPLRGVFKTERSNKLIVISKENGGKSDALNAGINVSRSPIICAIDADTVFEPDALLRAVQPFVEDPVHTIAVGGSIRVRNGCEIADGRVLRVGLPAKILPLFQTVEYLRAFLMARMSMSRLEVLTIISGAFGLFRRQVAIAVGGYSHEIVGEDLELVVKMHRFFRNRRKHYRIVFSPEAVCWTEAPETWKVLANQRRRWQRGAIQTLFKHADMMANSRYGEVSWFGLGQMLLVDLVGPCVEIAGYILIPLFYLLGFLDFSFFLAYLAVTFAFGVFISVGSLVLEELELRRFPYARDLAVLTWAAVLENFGYRQLNTIWRVQGTWQYFKGMQGWGAATARV